MGGISILYILCHGGCGLHEQKDTLCQVRCYCILMQARLNLPPIGPVCPVLNSLPPLGPVCPELPGNANYNSNRPECPRNAGSHFMQPG